MRHFKRADLRELMEDRPAPCVSVYLPTHRHRVQANEDVIRFKNLVGSVEEELRKFPLSASKVNTILGSLRKLRETGRFWDYQLDGLAVFVCEDYISHFNLPISVPELVVVSDRFHLKPLVPMLEGCETFHLLALSQKYIRFFRGERSGLEELSLGDCPVSVEELLRVVSPEKQIQWHTGASARQGERAAMFHGHSDNEQDVVDDAANQLLSRVHHAVKAKLKDERTILFLVGVKEITARFRSMSSIKQLQEATIERNADNETPAELHKRALPLFDAYLEENRRNLVSQYAEMKGTGRAIRGVDKTVEALRMAKVDTLLAALDYQDWGKLNNGRLHHHEEKRTGDGDLVNIAIMEAHKTGAQVIGLSRDAMPDQAALAAILRYE